MLKVSLIQKENVKTVIINSKTDIQTLPEPKLKNNEIQEYEDVLGRLKGGIIIFDAINGGQYFTFQYINPVIEKSTGIKKENFIGAKLSQTIPKLKDLGITEILKNVYKTGITQKCDISIYKGDELVHWSENHFERLNSGKILNLHYNITNTKKSEQNYSDIFYNSIQGLAIFQEDHIVLVNNVLSQITGYSPDEIYNMDTNDLNKLFWENAGIGNLQKCVYDLLTGKEISKQREFSFTRKNGEKGWLHCYSVRIDYKDKPAVQIAFIDITPRVKAKKQLEEALNEKELLMHEMNHRVKNNLQIITSLLNLQSRYEKDYDPQEIIRNTKSRIKSMAITHEKIYRSSDFRCINMKKVFTQFAEEILNIYDVKGTITLNIDVDDLEIEMDTSVPLILIINELLTNSIKYAFPTKEHGTINLTLKNQEDNLILTYSDNGIGIPETIDINNPKTLGLTIINSLTSQIDGTIELTRNPGTTYTIKESNCKKET